MATSTVKHTASISLKARVIYSKDVAATKSFNKFRDLNYETGRVF